MIGELLAGFLSTVVGTILLITTILNPKLTFAPVFNDGAPGAGFFPIIFGVIFVLLGISLTVMNAVKLKKNGREGTKGEPVPKENIRSVLALFLSVVVFTGLWKLTRLFYPCVFALSLAINLLLKRKPVFSAIMSGGLTLFLYLMFTVGFHIRFII